MLMNTQQRARQWKLCVYGNSGVGKTYLGVTSPEPVILLAERQGYETIRTAARAMGKPIPPTFLMQSRTDFGDALNILKGGGPAVIENLCIRFVEDQDERNEYIAELPYKVPQTVVIDSVSEMFKLVWDHLMEQAPPKKAKDGLPDVTVRYWGVMTDRSQKLVRMCRDVPYNVVMLALMKDDERGEGSEKSRVVEPLTPMKSIPAMIMGVCNFVGVAMRERNTVTHEETHKVSIEYKRYVRFECAHYVMHKPIEGLGGQMEPHVGYWFDRLNTKAKKDDAPDEDAADAPSPKDEADPGPDADDDTHAADQAEHLDAAECATGEHDPVWNDQRANWECHKCDKELDSEDQPTEADDER